MERHSCRTYLAVWVTDNLNKEEIEQKLKSVCTRVERRKNHYVCGLNEEYSVDLNEMLRVTLKDFFGEEEFLKGLCDSYGVSVTLEAVPEIVKDSEEPNQILSPDKDIIAFLYRTGEAFDLDYYIY